MEGSTGPAQVYSRFDTAATHEPTAHIRLLNVHTDSVSDLLARYDIPRSLLPNLGLCTLNRKKAQATIHCVSIGAARREVEGRTGDAGTARAIYVKCLRGSLCRLCHPVPHAEEMRELRVGKMICFFFVCLTVSNGEDANPVPRTRTVDGERTSGERTGPFEPASNRSGTPPRGEERRVLRTSGPNQSPVPLLRRLAVDVGEEMSSGVCGRLASSDIDGSLQTKNS